MPRSRSNTGSMRVVDVVSTLLLILLLALSGASCARRAHVLDADRIEQGRAIYSGTVRIDPAAGHITAQWTIQVAPGAGDSVVFLLNESLEVSRVAGPGVRHVANAVADGQRRVTVHFTPDNVAQHRVIDIAYAGVPKMPGDGINSIRGDWVELALDSFWLPVVADFAHLITGTLGVTLPAGWRVATSGRTTAGRPTRVNADVPLIDIPISATPRFQVREAGPHRVFNVQASDDVVTRVASATQDCGDYLGTRYGTRASLPSLRIVLAPRSGPGYARKNYIVVTPTSDMTPMGLTRFLCHEVAHFWSTGANASGPDNWINEAFAEFVSARAVRTIIGATAHDSIVEHWRSNSIGQPPVWSGPTGRRPGAGVSYRKAPHLLYRLEQRIGEATMDKLLVRFMSEPIRTTPDIIQLVGEVAGEGERQWFDAEIRK